MLNVQLGYTLSGHIGVERDTTTLFISGDVKRGAVSLSA
jgi:hypothetical protein